jgi:hypothetical protein
MAFGETKFNIRFNKQQQLKGDDNMILKEITLPSEKEYTEYKSLIPAVDHWYWWLKTIYPDHDNCVYVVKGGSLTYGDVCGLAGGVRPLCIFSIEPTDSEFWSKPKKLIGSKRRYGMRDWTVLDVKDNELYILCDEVITGRCFDHDTNVWEHSELRQWLETEGLKIVTA